ncbi:MAG: rhomboid family intramembrane serine protease [Saprospiraceae bacterium]|nr:rhomboid family intramembrane serine protease [Saprospiraceae bacterium]
MTLEKDARYLLGKLRLSLLIAAIMTLLMVLQEFYGVKLAYYGIYPRHWVGVPGIFFSPFLHSSWGHFFSNLPPVIVLVLMMEVFYKRSSLFAMLGIMVTTGLMVWLMARTSFHIGASGMVYGLISFIFWSGLFRSNTRSIILSLIILTVYSSYFDGIKPREGISWESHLFGAFAGIIFAFVLKNIKEEGEDAEEKRPPDAEDQTYFLPRDTFEYTKAQRAQMLAEEE